MTESLARDLGRHLVDTKADHLRANCKANLPTIRIVPGVKDLEGQLAGLPIVVVGAGPSLDQALPLLAEKLPIIVAVDRAVRPLLAAGILPDFVVTVEQHPLGAEKLRGLRGLEKTPLVFDPICTPETVANWPGRLYTFDRPYLVTGKGALPGAPSGSQHDGPLGGSGVVVYAVGLAQLLGASEIILAGVDLGYPAGETSHASGVPQLPFDGQEARIEIPSCAGGLVETDVFMAANVEELSVIFKGEHLVQTSPAGALIPGWRLERLEDVL